MDEKTFYNTIYCNCGECHKCLKRAQKRALKNDAQKAVIMEKMKQKSKSKNWEILFKQQNEKTK